MESVYLPLFRFSPTTGNLETEYKYIHFPFSIKMEYEKWTYVDGAELADSILDVSAEPHPSF